MKIYVVLLKWFYFLSNPNEFLLSRILHDKDENGNDDDYADCYLYYCCYDDDEIYWRYKIETDFFLSIKMS